MTFHRCIAILHDTRTPTSAGEPVLCALGPDGVPKPVLDHHGVLYELLDGDGAGGVFDYTRLPPPKSPSESSDCG